MKALVKRIAKSPKVRFLTLLGGSLLLSIVVGVYVNLVTPAPGQLFDWKHAFSGGHFFGLLGALAFWVGLNWLLWNEDEDVAKFADNVHCIAFARKARLEAYARDLARGERGKAKSAAEVLRELGLNP